MGPDMSLARIIASVSAALSMLAVFLVVSAWLDVDHIAVEQATPITTPDALDQHLTESAAADLIQLPTGVFVRSVAFVSSTDINVTGVIWQKYPKDFPYEKGISFAEEIEAFDTTVERAYSETVIFGGVPYDLVGYSFDVTVRQSFDYARYPLDHLTLWLRLWPADWDAHKAVVFTPDFESYTDTSRPVFGIDGDIVQGEWTIDETYFSYQNMPYDTNFGLAVAPAAQSEFFYNLAAQRKFINAFIINLVPLLVISLLLFLTLMTISGDRNQAVRFGFNTTGVLGTCSGLFFLVLLSHIQVRSLFPGSGLVYIEYFYLVLYGMILLVALNGYLFSLIRFEHVTLLHWHDNFVAKVGFWPLLLWALVWVSWAVL